MSDWKEKRLNCENCGKCLTRSALRRHRLKSSCADRRLSGPHGYRAERRKRLLAVVDATVVHDCTTCGRRFERLASLKRHTRLKHPGLVNGEETKGNIQCGRCVERSFSSVVDLCYHVSRHSDHWQADGNISGYSLLTGAFDTVDEFVTWKERLQATCGIYFVAKRGAARLKKSNQLVSYFYCSKNPKSARRNKEKADKNQNWYCTAFVKAVQQENGSMTVLYCPDHYMHAAKYRRQQQLSILLAPTPLSEDDLQKRLADDSANVVKRSLADDKHQQPLSASQAPPTLIPMEPNQFDNSYAAGDEDFTTRLQERTRGVLLETLHLVREAIQPSNTTNKWRRETLERIYEAAAAVRDLAQDLLCDEEDVAVR